jgi:hypothetical protein
LRIYLGEFHAHPLARRNASHNPPGLNEASGYFKDQSQARAYRSYMGPGDEHSSCAYGLDAGNLLIATAVPGHEHAVRQRDTLGTTYPTMGFSGHKQNKGTISIGRDPIEQMFLSASTLVIQSAVTPRFGCQANCVRCVAIDDTHTL